MKQYSPRDYRKGAPVPEFFIQREVQFTLVELEDIGPVSIPSNAQKEEAGDVYEEEPSSQEQTEYGLPLSFGSTKRGFQSKKSKKRKKKRAMISKAPRKPQTQPQQLPYSDSLHKPEEESATQSEDREDKESSLQVISAEDPSKKQHHYSAEFRTMYGRNLFKYWRLRYSLFSKFDEGIHIDKQGWYSVTPECIARHQACRCTPSHSLVLDAFCGCGGNAIQFALQGHQVIAVDINLERLLMAQHNAQIYNVQHRINFVLGDVFVVASRIRPDTVFVSPPWGGPHYTNQDYITLNSDLGQFVMKMLELMKRPEMCDARTMLYLPRNFDLSSLMMHLDTVQLHLTEIEVMKLNGILKATTVWLD